MNLRREVLMARYICGGQDKETAAGSRLLVGRVFQIPEIDG